MSRKRRRPNRSSSKPGRHIKEATLESARNYLHAGRFREAIAQFKELRKKDPADPGLTTGLIESYEGRAQQLEAKGMLKEALVIRENLSRLEGAPISADHIGLLLKFGRIEEVLTHYRDATGLGSDVKRTISAHFAAQYLGGATKLDQTLAEDDPVLVHGLAAREALNAYSEADDATLQKALAAIPFRSPYRDFVLILKALTSTDQSSELLARIPSETAFAKLRDAVTLALSPERLLPAKLGETGPNTRDLVFALRGWSHKRQALWRDLQTLGDPPSGKGLRALIKSHRKELGDDWTRRYELRLTLLEDTPRRSFFNFRSGPQSEMQARQLEAWRAEIAQEPWEAAEAWEDFALQLISSESPAAHGNNAALYAAAALRRPEYFFRVLSHDAGKPAPDSLEERMVEMLEQSLEIDPGDTECHLRLIRFYRSTAQLKEARRVLSQAQQRWPKDKAVLTEAMETALAGGAYKKAAGIARNILDIDPINSGVRERLVAAHVAHARKHLRGKRPDLAGQSVAEAATWANSERARERVELTQGFVSLATNPELGETELRALSKRLGDGLAARLVLALAGEQSGHRLTNLLKRLNLLKAPKAEHRDLLSFLERVRERLDAGAAISVDIAKYFTKLLRQAARLELDKAEAESACETLRRADMQTSRANFAKVALKRWRGEPVFEYHELDAKLVEHGMWRFDRKDINRLERAQDRARANGDMRLVERIYDTLSPFGSPFGFAPPGPLSGFASDPLDEPAVEPMELLGQLISVLDPDSLGDLLEQKSEIGDALRALRDAMGEPMFRAMVEQLSEESDIELFNPFDVDFPPGGRPPRPKVNKPTPKKQPNPKDESPDDEFPDQPDLFE